jgi:hypothetical protein
MDRTLLFLLVALALTYLAWRAAREQTARAHRARAAEQERNSCTLEAVETADGRGFIVVRPDGSRSDGADLSWTDHGLEVVDVDVRGDAGDTTSPAFRPGRDVELIPTDDDARLEVWDAGMTLRAGALDEATSARVGRRTEADEVGGCIVLRETVRAGRLVRLRLLLVHVDMMLDPPDEA